MNADPEELAALYDVRSVTISWVGDEDEPTVTFEGCSQFEAWGMTQAAARKIGMLCYVRLDDVDDEDD